MSGERVKKTMSLFGRNDSVDYSERVLGKLWDPVNDTFHFSAKLNFSAKNRKIHSASNLKPDGASHRIPSKLTRRIVLSQMNEIYDPGGLISPFTVRAKIMIRKLWSQERKLEWDDPLREKLWINGP